MIINVTIEIPMESNPVKYEVDDMTGELYLDRFLDTAMYYPCNYGFIPNTKAEDGDPVDVLVISPYPLISGCIARCKVLGVLEMEDEDGIDNKILAVPNDRLYEHMNNIDDVPKRTLDQIRHFFQHYKDLDPGRWAKVEGWKDAAEAKLVINKSHNFGGTILHDGQ
jgi:inorganic pyrophosphatase